MLAIFHRRLASPNPVSLLLQADGDQLWPLADGAVRVIFSSRALHLLDLAHVVDESCRVAKPDGASLIIGRIQRPTGSLPTLLQQAMQRLLRQQGFSRPRRRAASAPTPGSLCASVVEGCSIRWLSCAGP